jgi:hypothetical protein
MTSISNALKHNPLTVYAYNKFLDVRCNGVDSYIFVASTGRTGTVSLAKIFEQINKAASFHEPYPIMLNDYPHGACKKKYFDSLFNKLKRIYIKRAAIGNKYYIETNHMFVKNFIHQSIKQFDKKIKIIHLTRDPVSVARSFYQIGSIPGKSKRGKLYLLDPEDADNIIRYPSKIGKNQKFDDDLMRCIWYWYEIEARIQKFKGEYSNVFWYTIKTDYLNDLNKMLEMFDKMEISVDKNILEKIIGIKAHKKMNEKKAKVNLETIQNLNFAFQNILLNTYGKNFLSKILNNSV